MGQEFEVLETLRHRESTPASESDESGTDHDRLASIPWRFENPVGLATRRDAAVVPLNGWAFCALSAKEGREFVGYAAVKKGRGR
jgi:hypothetical protein